MTAKKIYFASKSKHGDKWKQFRDSLHGVEVVSTWINECGQGETTDHVDLWDRCINEAKSADGLVLYVEQGDVLKGALVEVGAALASGVPVVVVGDVEEHSWRHHRLVSLAMNVNQAVSLILYK